MKQQKLKVNSPEEEGRLDLFLTSHFPKYSRMFFKRLINDRLIQVDEHAVSPHHKLRQSQIVTISWPDNKPKRVDLDIKPLPFPVLFEDDHIMVINKPAGLLVHPAGRARYGDTLVEILFPRVHQEEWPDDVRPGLIHRLDRDTSGVLVFAKTPRAHAIVSNQFAKRVVKKTYQALVKGVMKIKEGSFECKMARDPRYRQRFAVVENGRSAVTKFTVKEIFGTQATQVELKPSTGRTHQLRVQLSHFHFPILGDHVYGGHQLGFEYILRHMLHAADIEFNHPETEKPVRFSAPLPKDFLAVRARLKK